MVPTTFSTHLPTWNPVNAQLGILSSVCPPQSLAMQCWVLLYNGLISLERKPWVRAPGTITNWQCYESFSHQRPARTFEQFQICYKQCKLFILCNLLDRLEGVRSVILCNWLWSQLCDVLPQCHTHHSQGHHCRSYTDIESQVAVCRVPGYSDPNLLFYRRFS